MSAGDRVLVEKGKETFEGILMPKAAGDPDTIVVKLGSGYNVGVAFEGAKMKKLKSEEKALKAGKPEFDKSKPPVSMVSTGGTITSRIDYKTGGVRALTEPSELLYNIPELFSIVNMRDIIRPFTKMSEDMDSADWQTLAEIIAKELNKDSRGVIITHGTDTLHYTSAALS